MNPLWGIDLGGTKIEGVVLPCPDSLDALCRIRVPTESEKGYEHIIGQIEKLVVTMEDSTGLKRGPIGFGTPGISDPVTGLMKNSNSTALNGRPLARDLAQRLGCPVKLANDANCFALAEAKFGAGAGAGSVFGVILGTGVGGGIVIGGRLHSGAQGIAGEWGHNELEPNGALCYCGKRGCVETVISGPCLERHYFDQSGVRKPLDEIVGLARSSNDKCAVETLARLVENFGKAMSVVVNILDPEVIVLGGGVGNIEELYSRGVESLARWVFNVNRARGLEARASGFIQTKILRPTLGDSAGVFGAAHLPT